MDALVSAIAAREVDREYLAIAHGHWTHGPLWHAQSAIGRDPRNRLRMAVVDLARQSGKPAATDIHVPADNGQFCLVRCVLHTGRTHQIRVHMAEMGHPLVGDTVYGGKPASGLAGQALHAFHLCFAHPVTAKRLHFEAAPPPGFLALLTAQGLGYNGLTPPG
jgi:23S rRNA pseudouridine1911/1915/1917 synthase